MLWHLAEVTAEWQAHWSLLVSSQLLGDVVFQPQNLLPFLWELAIRNGVFLLVREQSGKFILASLSFLILLALETSYCV